MRSVFPLEARIFGALLVVSGCLRGQALVSTGTNLRVVTYNIDADTNNTTFNPTTGAPSNVSPNFYTNTVLQGIGNYSLAGHSQPIDVLVLQELYGTPSVTLSAIVNDLNSVYGAGTYAYDANVYTQAGYNAGAVGNGPNGLIYNTKTVQDIGLHYVSQVGTSSNGIYREPVRYQLRPVGYSSNTDFYVYVDHYKADLGQSDAVARTNEALAVRQDADSLPTNSHIIFAGDFNLAGDTSSFDSGSNEQAYKNLTAAAGATLYSQIYNSGGSPRVITLPAAVAGEGQGNDALSSNFIADDSATANVELYTESATDLTARFDFQLVSNAALSQNNQPGLQLIPYTQTAFGNSFYAGTALGTNMSFNDSTNAGTSVAASNNTGPGLSQAVRTALTRITDHLPMVADYNFAEMLGDANCDGMVDSADLSALMSGQASQSTGWANGDFNHDGVINGDDWGLFELGLAEYNASVAMAPEPGMVVAGVLVSWSLKRPRRHGNAKPQAATAMV